MEIPHAFVSFSSTLCSKMKFHSLSISRPRIGAILGRGDFDIIVDYLSPSLLFRSIDTDAVK